MLLSPFRWLLSVFEKVAEQVDAELNGEEPVRRELATLYRQLDTGAISQRAFDEREVVLVDRLESIAARGSRRGRP